MILGEQRGGGGEYMRNGLTESGHAVDVASNGRDGLHIAQEIAYDLILLDVMMPEVDGWEVMTKLDKPGAPVLFLTARGTLEDRLKGLELGADDYLVKPFSFAELLARRIRVALRRGNQAPQENLLVLGDLQIRRAGRGHRGPM